MATRVRGKRMAAAFAAAMLAVLWVGTASATTMLYLSIEDMAQRSDAVVRGTVEGHTSYWTDQGQMFTDWTVVVSEVMQGNQVPDVITLRQMGGTVGDVTMRVPGDAELSDGEHVILFVVQEDGIWYLTALGQSKLSVSLQGGLGTPGGIQQVGATDVHPVQATLVRDLHDIAFYSPQAEGQPLYEMANEVMTLDDLRQRLAALRTEGGTP